MRWIGTWIAALTLLAAPAAAQEKAFRLRAAPELIDGGLMGHMLPRFSLKTGVRIAVEPLALPAERLEGADVYLLQSALLPDASGAVHNRPVMAEAGGRAYSIVIAPGDALPHAERFLDWLTSDVGAATLEVFAPDGGAAFVAVVPEAVEEVVEAPTGDAVLGEKIALRRCGRCHVVSKKNRFGGIGSTPSFGALRTLPRWRERFEAFWTLNPHPSFTQIEGVTEPFDPERPPHVAPLEMTLEEVEALMAFVISIEPKDLGPPLTLQ